MFFSGVSKHLPHLSRYLNYVVSRDRLNVGGEGWFAGLVGASTGLGVAAVFGLANAGVISANAPGPSAAILLPLAGIWGGIIAWSARKRRKEQMTPDYRLFQEAGEVAREMHSSLSRRRLHRELHPGVADLLEESARNWCRTMAALEMPFWQTNELASHWRAVRDQSAYAANQAMAELLVLLRSAFQPNPARTAFQDVVEDALETYVTGPQGPRTTDLMPVSFQQAREIAEKLKLVASEVERATQEAAEDKSSGQGLRSSSALDLALHDLRSVREAENELRQNVGS